MVSNYWDKMARLYDQNLKRSEHAYSKIIELLKKELKHSQTLLDIGTGTGQIPIVISGCVHKIFATDYSENMISLAKAKIEKPGLNNIIFQKKDCYQLDYQDRSFDIILATNLIHLLERPKDFLVSIKRLLKKDGKLIIPTYLHNENIKAKLISKILQLKGHWTATKFNSKSLIELVTESGYQIEKSHLIKNIMPIMYLMVNNKE